MAKAETKRDFVDCNASQFSSEVQDLLVQDRAIYEEQKANRKVIVAKLNAELDLPDGKVVTGIAFTRWGQMQLVIGDKVQPKPAAKPRMSLADYLDRQ